MYMQLAINEQQEGTDMMSFEFSDVNDAHYKNS